MAKPMVLVVDDQPEYARLISLSLAGEGFDVRTALDGEEALERASELHPDVVLLDVNMPGLNGFEVMAGLREQWTVPIIMVTGDDRPEQRTAGLDRGADDYLMKPFSGRELAARVRALLRRAGGVHGAYTVPHQRDGDAHLGRRATRLLELFRANPEKVLYHDELLAHAFGPAFVGDTPLLHEEIRRLRRALGIFPGGKGPIRTVKGLGYRFEGTTSAAAAPRPPASNRRKALGRA